MHGVGVPLRRMIALIRRPSEAHFLDDSGFVWYNATVG